MNQAPAAANNAAVLSSRVTYSVEGLAAGPGGASQWRPMCMTDETGRELTSSSDLERVRRALAEVRQMVAEDPKCGHWERFRIVRCEAVTTLVEEG